MSPPMMQQTTTREVWAHNLEQEFHLMLQIIEQEKHLYCSVDTEFPGVVLSAPEGTHLDKWERKWTEMRSNVDVLQLIQVGFALSDENGKPPPGCGCWQFNFKFDLTQDLHATDSIQLLQQAGCDFRRHRSDGICPYRFGELLFNSGLVLNDNVKWISFHGAYDFVYLIKVLRGAEAMRGAELPEQLDDLLELIAVFFPKRCDIKYLLKDTYRGGLQDLARQASCEVKGAHQAGVDALLTRDVFFALKDGEVFARAFDESRDDCGALYGLGNGQRRPVSGAWQTSAALMRRRQNSWDAQSCDSLTFYAGQQQWCNDTQYWGCDENWGCQMNGWDAQHYQDDWSTNVSSSWSSSSGMSGMSMVGPPNNYGPLWVGN